MSALDEEVLVIPSAVWNQLGNVVGFMPLSDRYWPALVDPAVLTYLPRRQAEVDENYKQLVPYAVLRANDEIYCYSRGQRGTEHRLHAALSFGIGGHIQRADGPVGLAAYEAGFARELAEEVDIDTQYTSTIIGLVHDDRTPVGRVHIGIVHLLQLSAPRVTWRDPALAEAAFRPLAELPALRDRMESWSAFVLDWLVSPTV